MKKKYLLLLSALGFCFLANAQETYFSCDFSQGIPEGFKLYDIDGLTPAPAVKEQFSLEKGQAWAATQVTAEESNYSIVSTSMYTPAGTANDWIITPAVRVGSPDACFIWSAANLGSEEKKDGYRILVSTKGQNPEDFDNAKVLYQTTTGEPSAGVIYSHIASLKEYAGQTVYIAAVNNSRDKSVLMMDDFCVKDCYVTLKIENSTPTVLTPGDEASFACRIVNSGLLEFRQNLVVRLKVNEETYTKDLGMIILKPGNKREVKFSDVKIAAPAKGESSGFTWEIDYERENQGKVTETLESAIHCIGTAYPRTVVVEEGTGTWCGYCVRGIVGMRAIREKYPDSFIGIAIHGNDIMQDKAYTDNMFDCVLSKFQSSYEWPFPSCFINRMKMDDPLLSKLEAAYQEAVVQPTPGSVRILSAEFTPDSTGVRIKVASSFAFNTDHADFSYSFIVIENDVQGKGAAYDQRNSYVDGSHGKMGGFEALPNPIPASQMVYQEVARGVMGEFNGIPNSVPKKLVKDEEVTFEYSFKLPESILKKKNIEVIALLLDNATGEIWNGHKIGAKDMPAGIKAEEARSEMEVYASKGELILSLESASETPIQLELFTLGGEKVKDVQLPLTGKHQVVPVESLKGFFIVRVTDGKHSITRKVIL